MVCVSWNYCIPSGTTDEECGEGWRASKSYANPNSRLCYIDCSGGGSCPENWYCMTSDPLGYYDVLNICKPE